MKGFISFFILILLPIWGQAETCAPELPAGKDCRIKVRKLHPLQFGFGEVQVDAKKEEIRSARKQGKKELNSFLKDDRVKIVIGPGNIYYILDGHHYTRAAFESGIEEVYGEIVANYFDLSQEKFIRLLKRKKWVYLIDEHGRKRAFKSLPSHVRQMKENIRISVAALAAKAGAIDKVEYFDQLRHAERLRQRGLVVKKGRKGISFAVKEAILEFMDPQNRDLSGYIRVRASDRKEIAKSCWKDFKRFAK